MKLVMGKTVMPQMHQQIPSEFAMQMSGMQGP